MGCTDIQNRTWQRDTINIHQRQWTLVYTQTFSQKIHKKFLMVASSNYTSFCIVSIYKMYGFSSSHVQMWVGTIKKAENWRFSTVVLKKTLFWRRRRRRLLREQGDHISQPWTFFGRTDDEAPILWPSVMKSRLTRKDPDAGKYWGQEENRATEDEIVGWHHGLNGHEFEQTPGDSEGRGSLACCSPWGCKESDTT